MSDVKRYTLYPQLKPEALAFLPDVVVDAKAFDALLAERDALAAILGKCRDYLKPAHDACMRASRYEEARHKPGHDLYEQIEAALQGEQP